MFQMFNQFFNMFTRLFSAGEKVAISIDNLASVGEKKSAVYLAEEDNKLENRRFELAKQLKALK